MPARATAMRGADVSLPGRSRCARSRADRVLSWYPETPMTKRVCPRRAALSRYFAVACLALAAPALGAGCGDGTSGDAGTVSLSAAQEAASKKGVPKAVSLREGNLADKPLAKKGR
jgi:hypothetical protein